MANEHDIDETEVWAKFSATHHYKRDSKGIMRHIATDYFQLDPFSIEPLQKISKSDLIALLEPTETIDDN